MASRAAVAGSNWDNIRVQLAAPGATAVPTLSEWGFLVLGLALIALLVRGNRGMRSAG